MFERFSDGGRRVVVLSQEMARGFRHNYIGSEHILLALIVKDDVTSELLKANGIDGVFVKQKIAELVGWGQQALTGHLPFSPEGKKILEVALREQLVRRHETVESQHILLALMKDGEGRGAQILNEAQIAFPTFEEAIALTLPEAPPLPPPPGPVTADEVRAIVREEVRKAISETISGVTKVVAKAWNET